MNNDTNKLKLIIKPFEEDTWEEYEKCTFAFFPGCRLGGIEPEFVLRTYDTILAMQPDTAIVLQCCETPIEDTWNDLGRPTMIMACDECSQFFEDNYSQIKTISMKDFLNDPVSSQITKMILENDDITEEEKQENLSFLKEELLNYF